MRAAANAMFVTWTTLLPIIPELFIPRPEDRLRTILPSDWARAPAIFNPGGATGEVFGLFDQREKGLGHGWTTCACFFVAVTSCQVASRQDIL
jgi:hypothetical protein